MQTRSYHEGMSASTPHHMTASWHGQQLPTPRKLPERDLVSVQVQTDRLPSPVPKPLQSMPMPPPPPPPMQTRHREAPVRFAPEENVAVQTRHREAPIRFAPEESVAVTLPAPIPRLEPEPRGTFGRYLRDQSPEQHPGTRAGSVPPPKVIQANPARRMAKSSLGADPYRRANEYGMAPATVTTSDATTTDYSSSETEDLAAKYAAAVAAVAQQQKLGKAGQDLNLGHGPDLRVFMVQQRPIQQDPRMDMRNFNPAPLQSPPPSNRKMEKRGSGGKLLDEKPTDGTNSPLGGVFAQDSWSRYTLGKDAKSEKPKEKSKGQVKEIIEEEEEESFSGISNSPKKQSRSSSIITVRGKLFF